MKTLRQLPAAWLAAAALGLAAGPAAAASGTWSFSATLNGGGTLSGWFSGDSGADEVLSASELTGFHLSFSGQTGATPFTLGLDALTCDAGCGLWWTVGEATLGGRSGDGIYADDGTHFVSAGVAVALDAFARVDAIDEGEVMLRSLAPIAVSAVPEPGAAALFALGLGGLGWRLQKKSPARVLRRV